MITLYDYKRFANITDTAEDNKISAALTAATALASRYTGLSFSSGPKTARVNPTNFLVLPDTNVTAITSISFKEQGIWNEIDEKFDDLELTVDQFYLDFAGVVELMDVTLPSKPRSVTVVYTQDSTVPADYRLAVFELTQYYFRREFNYSKSIAGESIDFTDGSILPTQVKTILDMHRCL